MGRIASLTRAPAKGQEEQYPKEQHNKQERKISEDNDPVRKAIEKLHRPIRISCKWPGDPGDNLSKRDVYETEQDCQPGEDHHRRLDRQYKGVGDDRNQRDAPELVGHDGQGGQLGSQGEEHGRAERSGNVLGRSDGEAAGKQAGEPVLERLGVKDQAESGGKRKLKTNIPERIGINDGHDRSGGCQGVKTVLAAAQLSGKNSQSSHDGSAHDRGGGPHQHRVKDDPNHGGDSPPAASKQAAEKEDEHPRNDGDIEAGDGDDMSRAGVFVGLLQRGRKAVIVSKQDACQEGGFGLREDTVNMGNGLIFEGINQAQHRVASVEGQERGSCIRHIGKDSLARKVVLVGEILIFRRGLQMPAQPDHIPIMPIGSGGNASEDQDRGPAMIDHRHPGW